MAERGLSHLRRVEEFKIAFTSESARVSTDIGIWVESIRKMLVGSGNIEVLQFDSGS